MRRIGRRDPCPHRIAVADIQLRARDLGPFRFGGGGGFAQTFRVAADQSKPQARRRVGERKRTANAA